jgi:low temperature requirement protein LtrA
LHSSTHRIPRTEYRREAAMKTLSVAALGALVGTPSVMWLEGGAFEAPEPIWLAFWGLALLALSHRLRARAPERPEL